MGRHQEKIQFADAKAFLQALHPLHARWAPEPDRWFFRGHADSQWQLYPSAHRDSGRAPFMDSDFQPPLSETPPEHVEDWERILLGHTAEAFDAAGLDVPGHADVKDRLFDRSVPWPPRSVIPFMALAQHSGVPTRLLDWSTLAKVAAYFAAAGALGRTGDGNLAVIALNKDAIDASEVEVTTAPRSANPNLHAQAGIFTLRRGDHRRPLDELLIEALTQKLQQGSSRYTGFPIRIVLRKLTLPWSQADKLLALLRYEGISGSTMFPGYRGAVRGLRELLPSKWSPELDHEQDQSSEDDDAFG